jgi:hypothetical protein
MLLTLWNDLRIREIDTDDAQNKYRYLYHIYYPKDTSKPPVGVVYHKEKFHQFYHSMTTGNPYLGDPHKEVNHFELFKDDSSTDAGGDEQLTLQICNSVVTLNLGDLEAQKEQEKCGPQTAPQPSLLPHVLLSRHNCDYWWPPKLLQGPLWAKPNMRVLENPYLLKDPNEDLDPFLLELTKWDPSNQMKDKFVPALSMLFKGASRMEKDPQMMMMTMTEDMDLPEEDLLTKSPMATCRIMSPSP